MATDEIFGFPFRTENYLDDYYILFVQRIIWMIITFIDDGIATLAPAPMTHDSPVDRKKKRNTDGAMTFKYECPCGYEKIVGGKKADYRPLTLHRNRTLCTKQIVRPFPDDYLLKTYRQQVGGD